MRKQFVLLGLLFAANSTLVSATIIPITENFAGEVTDRQAFNQPDRLRLAGWLGLRIDTSESNRLEKLDVKRLLEGYRKRPGRQTWDGEHVGKWLHAATLPPWNHVALRAYQSGRTPPTGDTLVEVVLGEAVEELGVDDVTFIHMVETRGNAGAHPRGIVAELISKNDRTAT